MEYKSIEITKNVSTSSWNKQCSFTLNINVIPSKTLEFIISHKLAEDNLSSVTIDEINMSEIDNFKAHFIPHTSSIIGINDSFIRIKYPGETSYKNINWHFLKNMYKNNSKDTIIIKLLYAVSSLRKLTMIVLKNILFENFVSSCYNEAGSTNLTSDLDFSYIDFSNPYLSVTMMDVFYKTVKTIYGDESCNVFDTNYYICSTFFSENCYQSNTIHKNIQIISLSYGVTLQMIQRLFTLFNICSADVINEFIDFGSADDLSELELKKIKLCKSGTCNLDSRVRFVLDKFFQQKEIYINNEKKNIYCLDFPILIEHKFPDYNKFLLMDLYLDASILTTCINDLMYQNDSISNKTHNKIISHNYDNRYRNNLIYSQTYYNILNSIKENTNGYCSEDIQFKVILMLKCLMSLMSASANESYISDIAVSLVVYKIPLNIADPNLDLKRFIAFMDNLRFILEWYYMCLKDEKDENTNLAAKYKFFDSVCKYFVRILSLGPEYNELIGSIIEPSLLNNYNSRERANGRLLEHAEISSKSYVENSQKTLKYYIYQSRNRSDTIVTFPFFVNPVIENTYNALKDKNLATIIDPLIAFYLSKKNTLFIENVLKTSTSVFYKINSILNISTD